MSDINIGDPAPDFSLTTDGDGVVKLSQFKGQKIVLFFYPKDDTPGCTKEACSFRDHKKDFEKINAQIIGISKCSVTKHDKFKAKYDLNFPLASDENGNVCESYGTWKEKNMYGKKYMGIERSTFLIDEDGKIMQLWRKIKVPGHVEEIAEFIQGNTK